MTPAEYAIVYTRDWLDKNHCTAQQLSLDTGHSPSYVSTMLCGGASGAAMVKGLDAKVHFPDWIKEECKPVPRKEVAVKTYTKPGTHDYSWYVKRHIANPHPSAGVWG